ncbi:DUF4394 domain-containing protein [Parvularcula maris]|uniref:DUF4394 domain-containing protein n=1 Tax=Parvularcula maris TaxID=2965077 RepID=A0A9X2L7A6_9PROT|nr:DUF4394 domain-containing protein [Parvularcula maris]MCQ8184403.1 DUF4394 domain-containing protein [Parvularcula maris]
MHKTLSAISAAALSAVATASAAPTGFAIGGVDSNTLVRFDVENVGDATGIAISGDAASLDALAYRPETGELYGFSQDSQAVFLVDPLSGLTTFVASTEDFVGTDIAGFDFNNNIDAARIVGNNASNSVFFPNNTPPNVLGGAANNIFDLFYVSGDANEGTGPSIVANAYTFQIPGGDPSQVQYGLDSETNSLVTIGNNSGELNTVATVTLGGSELDFNANAGFDIFFSDEDENLAFALLDTIGGINLYAIDLITGEATDLGATTTGFGLLTGLAVFDPVPLPGAVVLFGSAIAGFGAWKRRRQSA